MTSAMASSFLCGHFKWRKQTRAWTKIRGSNARNPSCNASWAGREQKGLLDGIMGTTSKETVPGRGDGRVENTTAPAACEGDTKRARLPRLREATETLLSNMHRKAGRLTAGQEVVGFDEMERERILAASFVNRCSA
jgi:hypothetical protein